jgi:hypothetical protein
MHAAQTRLTRCAHSAVRSRRPESLGEPRFLRQMTPRRTRSSSGLEGRSWSPDTEEACPLVSLADRIGAPESSTLCEIVTNESGQFGYSGPGQTD